VLRTLSVILVAVVVTASACAAEKSNCSEVPGSWSMDFRPSDWNAPSCPTLPGLVLSTPAAQASECHDGCTCSFGEFSMRSEHDEDDFCGGSFEEACSADSSTMSCHMSFDTNTLARGFCRKTFSNRQDWCDYFFDFVKR
jgi:hypothetical protein